MEHNGTRSVLTYWGDERLPRNFWQKVRLSVDTSCWLWTGTLNAKGYGKIGGRLAHRLLYAKLIGPIPPGMELDHVRTRGCSHRNCVNPAHLEPVTSRVNTLRSVNAPAGVNARKTHCSHGHEFTPENTRITVSERYPHGKRACRICTRRLRSASKARLKASRQAAV